MDLFFDNRTPEAILERFALQTVNTPRGQVQFRRACNNPGAPVTHVLLHGIGSASASWVCQLNSVVEANDSGPRAKHVIAWDAPGYGGSTAVLPEQPQAEDYAAQLWSWLDALGVVQPVVLVGHSLGAIMAAKASRTSPHRVARLVLLAPARGYHHASPQERETKLKDRLNNLATLGPDGMAKKRASAMLSASASASQRGFIQYVMAQINPAGYTQAAYLLANSDLMDDVAHSRCPVDVASGSADSITPPEGCRGIAEKAHVKWIDLGEVGHACPLEAASAVNNLLGLQGGSSP